MEDRNSSDLSRFWWFMSNAVPPIGFFLYFKHRNQQPDKARKALMSAAIGVPIALVVSYIVNNFIFN